MAPSNSKPSALARSAIPDPSVLGITHHISARQATCSIRPPIALALQIPRPTPRSPLGHSPKTLTIKSAHTSPNYDTTTSICLSYTYIIPLALSAPIPPSPKSTAYALQSPRPSLPRSILLIKLLNPSVFHPTPFQQHPEVPSGKTLGPRPTWPTSR